MLLVLTSAELASAEVLIYAALREVVTILETGEFHDCRRILTKMIGIDDTTVPNNRATLGWKPNKYKYVPLEEALELTPAPSSTNRFTATVPPYWCTPTGIVKNPFSKMPQV
jgi:hypothetical protein